MSVFQKHTSFLFWNNKTITYDNKDGVIHVIAVATFHDKVHTAPQTTRDLVLSLIQREKNIKSLGNLSTSLNNVNDIENIFAKCKKIVKCIEDAFLNPYTPLGKARLQKEFFTLIIDDKY